MNQVLVVDDTESGRYLLKELLESHGYRVTVAGNGVEALAAAHSDAPDIIVSDALMPTMDGFSLCRAWMQDESLKAIPFVFYSGTYTTPEDGALALALGAACYIVKPWIRRRFSPSGPRCCGEWAQPAPGRRAMDTAEFHAHHGQ
jgi:hypothetical protein